MTSPMWRLPPFARHVAGERHIGDFMCQRVAGHHQPGAVALLVVPELPVLSGRIVPQVEIVVEGFDAFLHAVRPVDQADVALVDELRHVSRTEKGMIDDHGTFSFVSAGWAGRPGPSRRSAHPGGTG